MADTTKAPDSPARVPAKAQDPLFVLSLVAAFLGAMLLIFTGLLYLSSRWAVGDDLDIFQYTRWFLSGGLFLVVLAAGLQLGAIVDFFRQKRSWIAINVITMSGLALVLVLLVNYVASRHYRQFDLTGDKLYSISDETKKVLESLTRDVELVAILRSQDQQETDAIRRLLDQFVERTQRIKVRFVDPSADAKQFERVVRELDLKGRDYFDLLGVAVRSGSYDAAGVFKQDKLKQVKKDELWEFGGRNPMGDEGGGGRVFKGEQLLTSALLEVTEEVKPKLYFLAGHRELELEDMSPDGGLGAVAKLLRQRNYDLATLKLQDREKGDIPSDAAVVVIAGPESPLSASEVSALEVYVKNGGHLLVMLDAALTKKPGTDEIVFQELGLEALLKQYNVDVQKRMVCTFQQGMPQVGPDGQLYVQRVPSFRIYAANLDVSHAITRPLGGQRVVLNESRSLKVLTGNAQAKTTELVKAEGKRIATTGKPDEFYQTGRFPADAEEGKGATMAVAVEQELEPSKPEEKKDGVAAPKKATRIVVIGDRDWASNGGAGEEANLELLSNTLTWLIGQKRFIAQAKRPHSYKLELSPAKVLVYQLMALPGLPMFSIALGILVWILRQR